MAAIGPPLILGFPFLLRSGLAVVPGRDALVSLDSFQRRRKPAYQHGGMSAYALEVAEAHIQAEYSTELVRPRYFKWVAPDITLQSCLSGKQHVDKRTTKPRRSSDATTAPTVSFLDNKLEYFSILLCQHTLSSPSTPGMGPHRSSAHSRHVFLVFPAILPGA